MNNRSIVPPSWMDRLAIQVRRWSGVHRFGRWVRRTLWEALTDAYWEFVRGLFRNSARFGAPGKTFSVYQALRCGWPRTSGRIVLHDQGVPRVTGDSLLVLGGWGQHLEQPWPILWSEHHEVRLVTESLALVTRDKELCEESAYNKRWRSDTASRYFRLPAPTRLTGNWTSIVSHWVPTCGTPVYGHWLQTALPRLALLPEFPPDTRIIVPPNLAGYQKESLELLGVWDRCRPSPERHLEVERYFFSSPPAMEDCYSPYTVNFLRTALLPKGDPTYSGPRRFYFHRTGKNRRIENGDEVCEFFRTQGWGLVRDVELSLAQTIKLFSEAEMICSFLGSGMTNVIFCRPGCVVLQLAPDFQLDGWIDWIAQVVNVDYHFKIIPCGYEQRVRIDMDTLSQFLTDSGVASRAITPSIR